MTEKLHFDDLTKITCPPGMLNEDTLRRLEDWPYGWQYWGGNRWVNASSIFTASTHVFRARPTPLTQDVVPWHLLDDSLTVAHRYADGLAIAAERVDRATTTLLGKYMRIDLLKGYQRGTVGWEDSLQQRPEGV